MQLTRAADYAVRVMIHLASLPAGSRANRTELAQSAEVPEHFLAKVLQALVHARLVASRRGNEGGFTLERPPEQITLLDVIQAIEGPLQLNGCLMEDGCHRHVWCAAHHVWADAQAALGRVLGAATIASLAWKSTARRYTLVNQ